MKCLICKKGETSPNLVTVTLERGGMTLVVKSVPAKVCENCGEEYLEEQISARLLVQAEEALQAGVQVEVRSYRAA